METIGAAAHYRKSAVANAAAPVSALHGLTDRWVPDKSARSIIRFPLFFPPKAEARMLHRDVAFHRERGASYVSVYFVIAFVVTTLIAVVIAWMLSQKVTLAEKEAANLQTQLAEQSRMVGDTQKKYREFSAVVGFTAGGPDGSTEAATALVADARKTMGADAPAGGTIQDLLMASLKVNGDRAAAIAQRESKIKELEGSVASAQSETARVRADLQAQIDGLRKSADDQKNSDAARIQNLEQQVAQKEAAAKEASDKLTAATEAAEKAKAEWEKKIGLVEAKNADLNTKLGFLRAPATPKGSVVEVSETLPIGYIDLGEHERVVPGMRFEIVDFDSQRKLRSKGFAEVTSVESNMSRVRVESKDKNHPVTKGDLLLNPLFDPRGERKAVLVGRFPLSAGGRKGVEQRLKDLGIKVSEKVDASVDYLILGDAELANTGEPQDMESNAEVLAAAKFGTLRYSLKELSGYFSK
jgi:uncharacterized coiled-coil protein SlyX